MATVMLNNGRPIITATGGIGVSVDCCCGGELPQGCPHECSPGPSTLYFQSLIGITNEPCGNGCNSIGIYDFFDPAPGFATLPLLTQDQLNTLNASYPNVISNLSGGSYPNLFTNSPTTGYYGIHNPGCTISWFIVYFACGAPYYSYPLIIYDDNNWQWQQWQIYPLITACLSNLPDCVAYYNCAAATTAWFNSGNASMVGGVFGGHPGIGTFPCVIGVGTGTLTIKAS